MCKHTAVNKCANTRCANAELGAGGGVLCFRVWSSCSSFPFFPPSSQRSLSKVHQLQNFILETEKHSYLGKHTALPGTRKIAQCLEEKKNPKHFTGEIARTNSSVNLWTSPPLSHPQILPAHPLPAKNAFPPSSLLSASCWDQIGGGSEGGQPRLFFPPKPRRSAFLERRPLFCRFCSYHHPTLPLFRNFPSGNKKRLQNLIILVFHQVERSGRWRIGIWLLIYLPPAFFFFSCKWSCAAGSNCTNTICFIKPYARYLIYLHICAFRPVFFRSRKFISSPHCCHVYPVCAFYEIQPRVKPIAAWRWSSEDNFLRVLKKTFTTLQHRDPGSLQATIKRCHS